jgi:hypothetical protein
MRGRRHDKATVIREVYGEYRGGREEARCCVDHNRSKMICLFLLCTASHFLGTSEFRNVARASIYNFIETIIEIIYIFFSSFLKYNIYVTIEAESGRFYGPARLESASAAVQSEMPSVGILLASNHR